MPKTCCTFSSAPHQALLLLLQLLKFTYFEIPACVSRLLRQCSSTEALRSPYWLSIKGLPCLVLPLVALALQNVAKNVGGHGEGEPQVHYRGLAEGNTPETVAVLRTISGPGPVGGHSHCAEPVRVPFQLARGPSRPYFGRHSSPSQHTSPNLVILGSPHFFFKTLFLRPPLNDIIPEVIPKRFQNRVHRKGL